MDDAQRDSNRDGREGSESNGPATRRPFFLRAVLYPDIYVWYVFLAALDIMMTRVVLHFGGWEANAVADWIIHKWGFGGAIVFKFCAVVFVVIICEIVGRVKRPLGRRLALWTVGLTAIPVVVAFGELLIVVFR